MNCKEFKNIMTEYLSDKEIPEEIEEHLENCPACRSEFEQMRNIVQSLKPSVEINTTDDFVQKTIHKLKMEDLKMKTRMPFWSKIAAAVLAVLVVGSLFAIVLNKRVLSEASASPARIFNSSLDFLSNVKSMDLEMKIRTLENDNFELIGIDYGFVNHRIKTEFSSPQKWAMVKPGRTVLCDGNNQYLSQKNRDYILKAPKDANLVDWLKIFLSPEKILEFEKQKAEKQKDSYTVKEENNRVILTVITSAQGDFKNDYLKNSSVTESDTKRIFVFDKKTSQLLSFELYIIKDKQEHLVMQTTRISYDVHFNPADFNVASLGSKKIVDIKELDPPADKQLQNMTPEETARFFFESCANNEWEKITGICPFSDVLQDVFGSLQVIEIGKHFKSGNYAGVFVPYTIRLKSGDVKKHNLALRNDNPNKIWVIDGGI